MIAQHFIFETHKPEDLIDAFKEASVLQKKHGAKEVSLCGCRVQKLIIFHFQRDAKIWSKWENAWMALLLMLILQHGKGNTLEPLL